MTISSTQEWVQGRDMAWREGLRRVSLVAELDVDDDDVERAERLLGVILRQYPVKTAAKHYPAFFLVALTFAGMRSWEEGTFYAKVAANLGVGKDQVEDATRIFKSCLEKYGLPTFDEARGMRWVTPVLLHGAVPLDHLDELLDLLAARRRRDPSLTGESFVEWARLSRRELATQPKALTRFLDYGGEFAPDFISRVIDLVDGNEVTLPRQATQRLTTLLAEGRGRTTRTREARPSIAIALDGSVLVRLPAVPPDHDRSVTWRVQLGDRVLEQVAQVPWQAGRTTTTSVSVEIAEPVRDVVIERPGSTAVIPFVRREDPLLVFDDDGEFVPTARTVPAGPVTVMWPNSLMTNAIPLDRDGQPLNGVEGYPPYGWDRWSVLKATMPAGGGIRLGEGPLHRAAGSDRARIVAERVIRSLLTGDGREVVSGVPSVMLPVEATPSEWTVAVADRDGSLVELIIPSSRQVALLGARTAPCVDDLSITVRGPLGRGATRRVVVAEGIAVHAQPTYRALSARGGLEPGLVTVARDGRVLGEVALSQSQPRGQLEVDGYPFVVEPEHPEYCLVQLDLPGEWRTEALALTPSSVDDGVLRFRGLDPSGRPRLILSSGSERQEILPRAGRPGSPEFKLAAFSDFAHRAGSGTLTLQVGPDEIAVAHFRPASLVVDLVLEQSRLVAQTEFDAPLEMVVHRDAAPWEPGTILPVLPGGTPLPPTFLEGGAIRVQVRTVNEWVPAATDVYPEMGRDVFDLALPWDPSHENAEERAVARALAGEPYDQDDLVTDSTTARTIEALALSRPATLRTSVRAQLTRLLADHPAQTMHGLVATRATTPAITAALIESGLTSRPAEMLSALDLTESLLPRSPLASVLVASAHLAEPRERDGRVAGLLAEELGEDLDLLWSGYPDNQKIGRFEPEFSRIPERVKQLYNFLDPVPGLMLDEDTRIAAVYEMWQARGQLGFSAKGAMPEINLARHVVERRAPRLWPMVQGRLSQDGVIALPALSIAHALIARLAAHGDDAAVKVAADRRPSYTLLARHAPSLVAIDLVRADAAVIGGTQ